MKLAQSPSHLGLAAARFLRAAAIASVLPNLAIAQIEETHPAQEPAFYIREYRVTGVTKLTELERGQAVYPYLGPNRTASDIDAARAALQDAYKAKGYETVQVDAPFPAPRGGVVHLRVTETKIGQLRVNHASYFLPSQIEKNAPSLRPGVVINFEDVQRDLLALNQFPDRRVTPSMKSGVEPGTVDVDLEVEDKLPLHASLELNNRRSPGTTPLRINGSISYTNLWQRGHTFGTSFQLSPEDLEEVKVLSAYYLARFAEHPQLSLLLQATKQNSNVSTLGGSATAGKGETAGLRTIFNLPPGNGLSHSASFGFDLKRFDQTVQLGSSSMNTPLTYFPFTAGYSAGWAGAKSQTDLNAAVSWAFRGLGSDDAEFDNNRFKGRGSFLYLRGDLAHTHELPFGAQLYAKAQGQLSGAPLVSSEQFAAGGLGTVRGYLEAETLGDNGILGSLELRSPSLLNWVNRKEVEWRIYLFAEGGWLGIEEALPEQQSEFTLASVGVGTRFQWSNWCHGSLDIGLPLSSLTTTQAGDIAVTFRLWSEF